MTEAPYLPAQSAKLNMSVEVIYRGYGQIFCTTYNMLYSECTTDKSFAWNCFQKCRHILKVYITGGQCKNDLSLNKTICHGINDPETICHWIRQSRMICRWINDHGILDDWVVNKTLRRVGAPALGCIKNCHAAAEPSCLLLCLIVYIAVAYVN